MSKLKNRNLLLSSHNRTSYSNSTKDELLSMKYLMDKPDLLLYPLNDLDESDSSDQQLIAGDASISHKNGLTYPDYEPWKDHTHLPKDKATEEREKLNNPVFLNKGYFESPYVSNEYYSSRNLIQAKMFSSTTNCNNILHELSQHLTNAYKTRNEVINKIKYESNNFKLPPRVTLTALKKESWLRDLSDPDIPLLKLSNKLPHGIRNKVMVDNLCTKQVPTTRAIWFTKCSLYSELLILRKKLQSKQHTVNHVSVPSPEILEAQWLQEWTQQVVDYTYKFAKEMLLVTSLDKKQIFTAKLNYLLTYIQTLYVESLLDKEFFLSAILRFLKEKLTLDPHSISLYLAASTDGDESSTDSYPIDVDINYGQTLVALTLIKIFWKDILKLDYLCKDLSEILLINYFFIERAPVPSSKQFNAKQNERVVIPQKLQQKLLSLISDSVSYLFMYNTNVFIIPNYWILISGVLYKILLGDKSSFVADDEQDELRKQLQLINYRNESLMLNMRHLNHTGNSAEIVPPQATGRRHSVRRSSFLNVPFSSQSINSPSIKSISQDLTESGHTFISRKNDDLLNIISQLDKFKLNDDLASLLKPKPSEVANSATWKVHLKMVIYWCITNTREPQPSSEGVLNVCNFLKRKVLQNLTTKSVHKLKAEFENEILEIIYDIVRRPDADIMHYNLYVLINELYQLKIIAISSYLRKLIASGIFYISPEDDSMNSKAHNLQIDIHLCILKNLPVLNNKQCDNILQKWTPDGFDFKKKFEEGKKVLQEQIVDKLLNNSFDKNFEDSIKYIKNLNVGLKFLLANWLTTALKTSISECPKLIYITPSIITNIYKFYSLCDNLTVFFKVFVKFLLKNEGKVIILYLDSLYLTAQLIIRHFKLVKFIAGKNYESANTGYELFKLAIINYKDLLDRDFDYFLFTDIWIFIDKAVEKSYSFVSSSNEDPVRNFNKFMFSSEAVDSPMKIHTLENKNNEKYSSEQFKNDLESLLEDPPKIMSFEEIDDALSFFENLRVDIDTYKDISKTKDSVSTILNFFFQNNVNEGQEIGLMKLLVNAKRLLSIEGDTLFYTLAQSSMMDIIKCHSVSVEPLIVFFKKLLIYDIFRMHELVLSLQSIKELGVQKVCNLITYDILYGTQGEESDTLYNHQILKMTTLRSFYIKRYGSSFLLLTVKALKEQNGSIYNSYIMKTYKSEVLSVLRNSFFLHTKLLFDELSRTLSLENIISICNELLYKSADPITSKNDIITLISITNEFNLPIVQCLLKSITIKDLQKLSDDEVHFELSKIVEIVLDNLKFEFASYNSYFGELFNYLNWDYKAKIFNILENIFIQETTFSPCFENTNDPNFANEVVTLYRSNSLLNLLPVLKDYFKKFSVSSLDNVPSSLQFFQDLSNFLIKLVNSVNSDFIDVCYRNLCDSISIFLRILIIHKISLISVIIRHDAEHFTFIENLITLLNSKFLSRNNDKLKILLYDLLLLMKSSLTVALTSTSESESILSTSPAVNNTTSFSPYEDGLKSGGNELVGDVNTEERHEFSKPPASGLSLVSSMFNLPEPNNTNPFTDFIDDTKVDCAMMLDEKELRQDGDIHSINDSDLILIPARRDSVSLTSAFGILGGTNIQQQQLTGKEFTLKSFQLLEDTGTGLNDGCINLLLFDAYTTKENPP